jgi:hypothetical protein
MFIFKETYFNQEHIVSVVLMFVNTVDWILGTVAQIEKGNPKYKLFSSPSEAQILNEV